MLGTELERPVKLLRVQGQVQGQGQGQGQGQVQVQVQVQVDVSPGVRSAPAARHRCSGHPLGLHRRCRTA